MSAETRRDPNKISAAEMTAADLHEMQVGFAMGCFDGDGLTPTFALLDDKGISLVCSPWSSEAEKNVTFEFVAHKLAEDNCKAYSLAHEIYMARHEVGKPYRMPSERHPSERDEVLFITTYGRAGEIFVTRFLITPARQGHAAKLGPRVDEPEAVAREYTGRIFNLFRSYAERMAENEFEDPIPR